MTEHADDWIEFERKVPDQVGPFQGGSGRGGIKEVMVVSGKGKKAKKVKLRVPRNMLQQEVKRWFNAALADAVNLDIPSGTPYKTNSFGAIAQGGGAANRIGDAIFVHKVVYRMFISFDATITWSVAELAWVFDTEPAVGISNWNVVFNTIGGASNSLYHCAIPANDTRFRYKFAKRMTHVSATDFVWNGSAFTGTAKPLVLEVEIPVRKRVMYDATNAVYKGTELALYGWGGGAANQPKLSCSIQVFFSDA